MRSWGLMLLGWGTALAAANLSDTTVNVPQTIIAGIVIASGAFLTAGASK